MTTSDFIKKNFNVSATKERQCSSVFADYQGNLYSYGYHYPLLFTVEGRTVRNVRGYSSTTSKHISWAGGMDAIDIEAPRSYRISDGLQPLIDSQTEYVQGLKRELDAKVRKDTQVYESLKTKYIQAASNLMQLVNN